MMHDNRMYELLVLFRDARKLRRPTWKQAIKWSGTALLLLALVAGSTIGLVRVHKRHVAKEFLETLYTVTEEDLIDPQPRIDRLYALAEEQFVDGLLRTDSVPAVYFREKGIPMTMSFIAAHDAAFEQRFPQPGIIAFPGSVVLHNGAVAYASEPTPAFYLFMDGSSVGDLLAPGLRWKTLARAEWE